MFIGQDGRYHEECGVFGIFAPGEDVARLTYLGLFALQHRGQEGCGIAVLKDGALQHHKALGLVNEVFSEDILTKLGTGQAAIGHVRYSTTGGNSQVNTQPVVGHYGHGALALAHNGNLANNEALHKKLYKHGAVFQSTTDTEAVVHLLASFGDVPLAEAMALAMKELRGAYAFVSLNGHELVAARDPQGNRPLCLGRLGEKGWVVASESCALETVGATFVRDVNPGEILVIDHQGVRVHQENMGCQRCAHCIFEYVYFARPDSTLDGVNVNTARRQMGEILAREIEKLDVDIVIGVPDSGTTAAIGFAEAQGTKFTQGIMKNRYAGRTFIQPTQALRELMVNLKLNPITETLKGKKVAVVDDSIVRGTTSRRLVTRLREHGAAEVHFLLSCPPVTHPCYYGIDTGEADTLIAATHNLDEIRQHIGADSLHYLSLPGLIESVGGENKFCTACLSGDYPMGTPTESN